MRFLSNYKITHKLMAMGMMSIFVAVMLAVAFQYIFHIGNQLHKEELLLRDAFEKVWAIQLNASKLKTIERELFKGGNLGAKTLFDQYQDRILSDAEWLEVFFKDDAKALKIIDFVKLNKESYGNTVKEIIDEYQANGLRPVTNIINYMPDAKSIDLKLKELNIPDRVVLEWVDSRRHELFFFGDRSPDILPNYYKSMKIFRQSLESLSLEENKKVSIISLLDSHDSYFMKVSRVFKSVWVKEESLSNSILRYQKFLQSLKDHSDVVLLGLKDNVATTQKYVLIAFYALLLVSIVLLSACLLFIVKNVKQTTSEVKDILQGIAMGDARLSERLPEVGKNEMAEVAHWFNHLMDKLQNSMTHVGKLSCDLTEIAFSAQKRRDKTSVVFEGQVDRVHNISLLITSMDEQVLKATDHAKEAANSAAKANSNANSGAEVVSNLIHSMNLLASNVEETSQSVIELDEHAKTINTVITMIEQIAEQTNLLALNAAIEAARAGEAGRGFAVVADEVRNLSMRTTESTQEIHKIIVVLQDATQQVVEAMKQNREQATAGVQLANTADSSLHSITQSVESIDRLNEQVLESTLENQKAIHQITTDFDPIRSAIDDLSVATKKSISDSADLTQTASMLQTVTASFGMTTFCETGLDEDKEPAAHDGEDSVELF